MPTTVDPYGARPYIAPPESTASDSRANSLRLRIRTARHRAKLTHALAQGADPDANGELALRARQLTSHRNRRAVYNHTEPRALRRMIRTAAAALDAPPSQSHEFTLAA